MNFPTLTVSLSGSTSSAAVDLGGASIIAIVPDADWTGTILTFQASVDDTNYYDVYDEEGAKVSYTVATVLYTAIPPATAIAMDQVKIVSDQSETATVTLLLK